VADITPAREAMEVAITGALGKAWRMYGAHLSSDLSGRGVPLEYPEIRAEAERVLAAAEAWAADEVLRTADVTLGRAREAEAGTRAARGELADLEGGLAQVITAALKGERARAEAAEAKLAGARELAEAWADDDGQGPPTPEMLTEAACGKALLDLLAAEEVPGA
jgi:hypothetical protein